MRFLVSHPKMCITFDNCVLIRGIAMMDGGLLEFVNI